MKIVHFYANGCFDWLISGQQSVNKSREAISAVFRKYERFTFVHSVSTNKVAAAEEVPFLVPLEQKVVKYV